MLDAAALISDGNKMAFSPVKRLVNSIVISDDSAYGVTHFIS